ncbi:response regulator [Escherichia coli]
MPFDFDQLDIQMPDMDGIRACELIHQLPHQQQAPVIAVTAHAMAGQREAAWRRDERLSAKPIQEERLHNLLLRYKPGSGISSAFADGPKSTKLW